jgi:hypothetical protein
MADIINYWTIASIIVGLAVLLPFIMGFFSGNKFDVKGKVSLQESLSQLLQPRLTRCRQSSSQAPPREWARVSRSSSRRKERTS